MTTIAITPNQLAAGVFLSNASPEEIAKIGDYTNATPEDVAYLNTAPRSELEEVHAGRLRIGAEADDD